MSSSRARARAAGRADKGQAALELALVTPLIATLMLCVVQVGLIVFHQLELTHASREAARQAAVAPGNQAPREAALAGSSLRDEGLELSLSARGEPGSLITATLRYRETTNLPLVGALIPDFTLVAATTMRVEV